MNNITDTQLIDTSALIEELKLVANDPQPYARFGWSVSISADGSRVAIGAIGKNENNINGAGVVYIFSKSDSGWIQEAKLVANDPETLSYFSDSVFISADGDRVAIGSIYKNVGGFTSVGAVYIFVRSGTTWTQEAKLVTNDPQDNDHFGHSVSMTGDGNKVVVGAYLKTEGSFIGAGAAYIFSRTDSGWTQEAKLLANDLQEGAWFGNSVSIVNSGDCVAIGSINKNEGHYIRAGAVYIFSKSDSGWTQETKLVASKPRDNDYFGYSVSMSGNGDSMAVGALIKNETAFYKTGITYIFSRSDSGWIEEAKLLADDIQTSPNFGNSVSMSLNGDRVAVGAYGKNQYGFIASGAVYIFTKSDSGWIQKSKLVPTDPENSAYFGNSISITANGDRVVVGDMYNGFNLAGAVFIF